MQKTLRLVPRQVDIGRSLSRDKKSTANATVPKGQGDRGDQRKSK
ncbi:hypothetical protein [Nitrospira sp. Nam74]